MFDKKIIAIVGATGSQGGGLARAILNSPDKEFSVRAITRNINSDKAKELSASGAEVVDADLDNINSLNKAFDGAYGAFCITNFWEHFSAEKEISQANNMAQAAKQAGVKHVIWSTLEDTRKWIPLSDNRMPTIHNKYKVAHFDGKGESDHLFTDAGVPVTFLLTSFYWDNFIYFGSGPQKGPDGKYYLTFPMDDKKLPGIAAEDIGKCALGIFKKGSEYIGKHVAISGENLTGAQLADKLSKALGIDVFYNNVSPDVYRSFDFPGALDMGNMYQFKRDFEDYFSGIRNPEVARKLNPELLTFDIWLENNKSKIPLE